MFPLLNYNTAWIKIAIESAIGGGEQKLSASLITLTGLSTVSLRKQWRMQLAHDLLRYTNLPFTDVMQRCGYTSMPTFSNFVRQAWGSTPKTIRINAQRRDEIGKYAL